MIPDCENRTDRAKSDLAAFLASAGADLEPALLTEAQSLLA